MGEEKVGEFKLIDEIQTKKFYLKLLKQKMLTFTPKNRLDMPFPLPTRSEPKYTAKIYQ